MKGSMNGNRRDAPFRVALVLVISRAVFLVALIIQCIPSWAGYPPMVPILQPYQVSSPDGTWVLDVKPGNREAAGPAATTLTNAKTGQIAWKRMLPYTFWQCCVNNDGVVGGYAYTKGVMGENDQTKDAGNFIVSFLDSQGVPMHEESTHRTPSSVGMGYYVPAHWAYRLFLDGGNDRMILIMSDGLFRCYDMGSGTLKGAFSPESKGDASGYEGPDEIRFIPNTRLILLQSNSAWGNSTETTATSCIQIIDDNGRTVWAASQHRTFGADKTGPFPEYRIIDAGPSVDEDGNVDPFAGRDPFADGNDIPELCGPPAPTKVANFEVYFGDTGEKVTFHILDWGADGKPPSYRVIESFREKWTPPKKPSDEEETTPPADFPAVAAKTQAAFQLKRADGTPLTDIVATALGPEDMIHVLDRDKGLIHVFDRDGKFLHVCDPGKEHTIETSYYSASIAVDEKGHVFARISEQLGVSEAEKDRFAGHFLRFTQNGALEGKPLDPPARDVGGNIVAQPNANNLIFYGYGSEVAVNRRDQYGSRVATLTRRADGQWLEYINDVDCAPDGMIAVRDTSKGDTFGGFTTPFPRLPNKLPAATITIYTKDGEPIRTIDFSRFAGLSEIAFDGKHIAATFPWDPPTPMVYVFNAEGTPVGAIRIAELADKERVNLHPFIVSGGSEILAVDQESGMTFRFAMP